MLILEFNGGPDLSSVATGRQNMKIDANESLAWDFVDPCAITDHVFRGVS